MCACVCRYIYTHSIYTYSTHSTHSTHSIHTHTHTHTHQRSRSAELERIQAVNTDDRITTTECENASVCADPRAVDLYQYSRISRSVFP